MKAARLRLLIAALLLFGWLGWLGYLALTKTHPVVISRSQVMAATHFVLAEVTVDPATGQPVRDVKVVEDLRPVGEPLHGTIKVFNVKEARIGGGPPAFAANGPYLLVLTKTVDGFELTAPPRSPGHEGLMRQQPWAYVWQAEGVQAQFEALVPRR